MHRKLHGSDYGISNDLELLVSSTRIGDVVAEAHHQGFSPDWFLQTPHAGNAAHWELRRPLVNNGIISYLKGVIIYRCHNQTYAAYVEDISSSPERYIPPQHRRLHHTSPLILPYHHFKPSSNDATLIRSSDSPVAILTWMHGNELIPAGFHQLHFVRGSYQFPVPEITNGYWELQDKKGKPVAVVMTKVQTNGNNEKRPLYLIGEMI